VWKPRPLVRESDGVTLWYAHDNEWKEEKSVHPAESNWPVAQEDNRDLGTIVTMCDVFNAIDYPEVTPITN
jgi:hypothetical protein